VTKNGEECVCAGNKGRKKKHAMNKPFRVNSWRSITGDLPWVKTLINEKKIWKVQCII